MIVEVALGIILAIILLMFAPFLLRLAGWVLGLGVVGVLIAVLLAY